VTGPPPLEALDLDVRYDGRRALHGLSVQVERGEMLALVGPNGSGKSTLLRAMARLLAASGGAVLLDGEAIARLRSAEVARRLAVLPQGPAVPAGLTVQELVEQGRYPHRGPLRMPTPADRAAVEEALALTGLAAFRHRALDTLSGGERQRAWIALTLAQQTPAVLLDEPTTFLDLGHQLEVLDLVRRLNAERGLTVVLVLHDLNQAARYAHRMVVLDQGRVVAEGPPRQVLTARLCADVFAIRARILDDPDTGVPVCLPQAALPRSVPPVLVT
jgi:iron complex transport system ATP-binding protein